MGDFQEYLRPVDSLDSMASSIAEGEEEEEEKRERDSEGVAKALEQRERDSEAVARALEQREYRIRELIESERDYVTDLAQCVQYIQFMRQEVFYICAIQEGKPLFRYKLWRKGSILQTNDAEFYNSEQLFLLLCLFCL
jgi:hypothetical protein